ncbi:TRAP transporter fused permease subunit [Halorubrum sp. JWXQ-INN 858]|uniref:TRAP transporter permease n=1 Tax=Halorubrum sp. JWXQ-INN 858 TaxID=2690782 RepID=UPI00135979C4|nr:TRAP transporter permease [Halorubrum sp. JWXQ-INN 858]MWV65873.1 TRAP transporter fused permease subunit [Halorubrum sp. JWXQ-INN 858]
MTTDNEDTDPETNGTDTEPPDGTETDLGLDLSETDETEASRRGTHLSGYGKRKLDGTFVAKVVTFLAVTLGGYHVVTAYTGVPGAFTNRPIHLAVMMALSFLVYGAWEGVAGERVPWYDWVLAALSFPAVLYLAYAINYGGAAARAGSPTTLDAIFGALTLVLVLEMTRRTTGVILPVIASSFVVYAFLGPMMPGLLAHRGYGYERILSHLYMTTEGIFGIPLGVSATFVVLFIIFGAFLEVTGIGDWFIDLAYGVTGRLSGGPAKTSVLASGFMASLNGSAVANTATTGAFTIPLMKRTGFDDYYAAAVESSASSGGQIMPPVMGAGAFIMAVWTGISYADIIISATVPAMLFFLCVGMAVHFRAKKQGLEGLPKSQLPDSRTLLIYRFYYTLPIIVLVFMLVQGFTAMRAGFWAILLAIIVCVFPNRIRRLSDLRDPDSGESVGRLLRDSLQLLADGLERGIRMTILVAAACATAGIVVGVVTLTGLGLKFSSLVASLSGGVVFIALVLTMIASILLGMGLPTTAAYVVVAALGAPALTQFGVDLLAAHLFIFYFAIISAITPPIMLAVFTASGIAESDPWKTGFTAINIASVGFIIPYLFVYGTELLLIGEPVDIVISVSTAIVGVIALSASTQAYLLKDASIVERVLLLAGALTLMFPDVLTDGVGIVILGVVFAKQYAAVNAAEPSGVTAD